MGDHQVSSHHDPQKMRAFMRALLNDVKALDRMIEQGLFEEGVRCIGAEQEVFFVDEAGRPAPTALKVLDELKDDDRFVSELATFNLEANLTPRFFAGDCLSAMERELRGALSRIDVAAAKADSRLLLTGILPTLEQSDLHLGNMVPSPRYEALNDVVKAMMPDGVFKLRLKGLDELDVTHDNVMVEAMNTSFQIHFQVGPSEFAHLYNVAQAVAGPVLAAAANSPLLFGRRLWHESRVAVFQQSIDARSFGQQKRGHRARVDFGYGWIEKSVLEIFREDIARFRVVLGADCDEDALEVLGRGEVPSLRALRTHNGTVYRWNRPCYGISDNGRPHLRIEARMLPAGPTVIDQMANAALFFGLMAGLSREVPSLPEVMEFDHARENFFAAARSGLGAQMTWLHGQSLPVGELLTEHLVPLARAGLETCGIDRADADRYLGVIDERARTGRSGAWWSLRSLTEIGSKGKTSQRMQAVVKATLQRQETERPAHTWNLATMEEVSDWTQSFRTVGQFMSTDVFAVRPWDVVDLVACVMTWEKIRHVPVEDDDGHIVGLVSHRAVLRLVADGHTQGEKADEPVAVAAIMQPDPVVCHPETPTLEAIGLMRRHRVGCLPVIESDSKKLVGIVTERDFIDVAARLFEESLRPKGSRATAEDETGSAPSAGGSSAQGSEGAAAI